MSLVLTYVVEIAICILVVLFLGSSNVIEHSVLLLSHECVDQRILNHCSHRLQRE